MKKLALVTALLGLGALNQSAVAAATNGNFDVNITLTSACQVTAPTAGTTDFSYTSFQGTASTFSSSFTVRCTNTLPISHVRLDGATGASQTYTDLATNLDYTLTVGTVPAAGTGVAQSITLGGSMASGQAGTCASSSCTNSASTNKQRTLTITY